MPSPPLIPTRTSVGWAPLSLLTAATTWGLIWYPYRLLEQHGLSGSQSSLLTYLLGLPVLLWLARRQDWRGAPGQRFWLLATALTAGWTNLSYVLAVLHGEVMRVMLLFYLAPLWTVFFARFLLNERTELRGMVVMALALLGAIVMLDRDGSLPLPASAAEWLGLSSGMGFALTNVLTRKVRAVPIETRSLWVFAGVGLMAGLSTLLENGVSAQLSPISLPDWGMMAGIALALILATFTVQYGLARVSANRAIVILLFELVVAAFSSHFLAEESMQLRDWLGGALIVTATLFSVKEDRHD